MFSSTLTPAAIVPDNVQEWICILMLLLLFYPESDVLFKIIHVGMGNIIIRLLMKMRELQLLVFKLFKYLNVKYIANGL